MGDPNTLYPSMNGEIKIGKKIIVLLGFGFSWDPDWVDG